MTDQIKVSVEIDKLRAEQGLRDLSRQLTTVDTVMTQMRKSGIDWATDFKSSSEKLRENIEKVGLGFAHVTSMSSKGGKTLKNDIKALTSEVNKLQTSLLKTSSGLDFSSKGLKTSFVPKGDFEKTRADYYSKIQKQYQKEQEALRRHSASLESIRKQNLAKQQTQLQNRHRAREEFARAERESLKRQEQVQQNFWTKLNSSVQAQDSLNKLKSIQQLYKNLQRTSAASLSSTASLGGSKAVSAAMKEQAAATKRAELARKNKTKVDQEALRTGVKLADSSKRLGIAALNQAGQVNKLGAAWRLAKQNMKEGVSVANLFQAAARGLTGVIGGLVSTFVQFLKHTPQLASDMLGFRNALQLVTGSQGEAAKLLNTSIDIAVRLKLSIAAVTKEYSKFTNSATIAGLSVQKATHTFESFAIAARVLNLNQQRTSGMFLALEQMISKGRVSMEELRRQLGEHIPGALNLAAQAMGYGKDELGKFIKEVSNGNVVSIELVENLGKLLRERTIGLLPTALKKFSASLENFTNAWTQLGMKMGHVVGNVLGKGLDMVAEWVRAFAEWLPATDLLGTEIEKLSSSLEGVTSTATMVSDTFQSVTDSTTAIADASTSASDGLNKLKESFDFANVAGMAMLGTIGTAGLGGAFAALGKAFQWVKKGLKSFAAPFITLGDKLKPLVGLLGAGGLMKAINMLKKGFKALAFRVDYLLMRLIVLAALNPWTAAIAAITAAATAIYVYNDGTEEATRLNAEINKTFKEASERADAFNTRLEEVITTMADIGQTEIAIKAADVKVQNDKLIERKAILKESADYMADQYTVWDEINGIAGHVTPHARKLNRELHEINVALEQTSLSTDDLIGQVHEVDAAAALARQQFELIEKIVQDLVDKAKLTELNIKLNTIGMNDVERDIKLISHKFEVLRNKNFLELGVASAEPNNILNEQEKLEKQIIRRTASNKAYVSSLKAFDTGHSSAAKSIASTILKLEQQAQAFGKTGLALDTLNTQFKIQALEQKAVELETKAVTQAQRNQVAAMREQIQTVAALSQNMNLLKDQERLRVAAVEAGREATEKKKALMQEGHKLLSTTISLEQKFRLRLEEVVPALEAVGASNAQIKEVMKHEWRQIVDNADNGLKSMEALSEEFAKGMQDNFSNFFFEVMEGNFDNLADSFVSMLNRMVAEAIATNLTKYIMGPGGGGGLIDSFLGSGFGSALFGAAPAMPAIGGLASSGLGGPGTMAMGGGFVNLPGLAYGGNFDVGGTGGTDSQIVAFRATPGENINVTPPTKKGTFTPNIESGGTTIVNFNVTTPNADSFNASRGQMEVQLRSMVQRAGRNM